MDSVKYVIVFLPQCLLYLPLKGGSLVVSALFWVFAGVSVLKSGHSLCNRVTNGI